MNEEQACRKKSWRGLALKVGGGLLVLVVFMAWAGGAFRTQVEPGTVSRLPGAPLPEGAALAEVALAEVQPEVDVIGTAVSEETTHLSARISAYVESITASAGMVVTQGQVLVTLDDRELQEQLAAARARLQQAETEHQRTRKLYESGAATHQAMTSARNAFDAASAEMKKVQVMLSYTHIASPMDGIVTDRKIENGDLANPGQVLLSVYNPSRMRLESPVPLRLLAHLKLNQRIEVQLGRSAERLSGVVSAIVGEIDPSTRTQLVKVRLEQLDEPVLPGTYGRLWIREAPRSKLLVPAGSVYTSGQLELVQVVRDRRVVRRLVRTGRRYGDRVEIIAGLEAGEQILQQPLPALRSDHGS